MNPHSILVLASKIIGLHMVTVAFLASRPVLFPLIGGQEYDSYLAVTIAYTLADSVTCLFVAWFLLFRATWIADKLSDSEQTMNLSIGRKDATELAFMIIGILMMGHALPSILAELTQFMYFNDYDRSEAYLYWEQHNARGNIILGLFAFATGLMLSLNRRLLALRLDRKDEDRENEMQ